MPTLKKDDVKSRGYRILVVDDNLDSAQSMALLLKFKGHEVEMAHDGPSVLERTLAFQPHVILLDIGLPKMDGYEVARQLRDQLQLQHITLIAITGYGQIEDRQRVKEAGFAYHFIKPVDTDRLNELILSLDCSL